MPNEAKSKPRVLVAGPLHEDALTKLRDASLDVVVAPQGLRDPSLDDPAVARSFAGLVPLLTARIDDALLERFSGLRIVANVAVGVDNVDLSACRAHHVLVTNTPGVLTDATADLAFALLLAAARRVGEAERQLRKNGFPPWSPGFMLGKRLRGKILGIVGYGRIGRAVALRAKGFGLSVVATPSSPSTLDTPEDDVPRLPLDELLAVSDFVSVHVPLKESTRHLLGERELGSMKPGAVLVNTSRGAVIDEAALVRALRDGPLFAAGLDVYEHEPKVHEGLLALENVVLLPHIGSADADTRREMACLAADNVVAFFATGTALTPVT